MDRRRSIRGFLQAAVTGTPKAKDYEEAGLDGSLGRAARRWVALIRKTARPAPGARDAQSAAALIDEATEALVAALPDDWEAPKENPAELAERVHERSQ